MIQQKGRPPKKLFDSSKKETYRWIGYGLTRSGWAIKRIDGQEKQGYGRPGWGVQGQEGRVILGFSGETSTKTSLPSWVTIMKT